MSLTVTLKKRSKLMNMNLNIFEIDFDSSYPTGGEALSLATLGLPEGVSAVQILPKSGHIFEYDETNKKVKAFFPTAAHQHTYTASPVDANTAEAAEEVPAATDLSGLTGVKVFAYGR